MNCKQINSIRLEEVLSKLGHLPTKQNEKEAWFLNPFGSETQASFKVDRRLNYWYLFSEGIGGNNVDLLRKYFKCSISEALQWASDHYFSSFHHQEINIEKKYEITEISEIKNWNLKKYLRERGLSRKVYPFVREVKFTINQKKLYAIGFQNESGGWELRNSFYKGSLLKKDISIIKNASQEVAVLEGFMDALSLIEMSEKITSDLLILNSVSMVDKAIQKLKFYDKIHLYLDNDSSGRLTTGRIKSQFNNVENHSLLYRDFLDLNDFIKRK